MNYNSTFFLLLQVRFYFISLTFLLTCHFIALTINCAINESDFPIAIWNEILHKKCTCKSRFHNKIVNYNKLACTNRQTKSNCLTDRSERE